MTDNGNTTTIRTLIELSIAVPFHWNEMLAGYLFELGASAVEERSHEGQAVLVTHFPHDDIKSKISAIGSFLAGIAREMEFHGDLPKIEVKKIEDLPWAEEVRKSWKPTLIAGNYWAAPTWLKKNALPNGIVLRIDPGEAFGTGAHNSTRLAATLMLDELTKRDKASVLDIGSGTGILAMIAQRAGAKSVTATDNDPKAIEVAAENFNINNCVIDLTNQPIQALTGHFDIVVANILLETLLAMAPDLVRLARPGGAIVLAGLLEEQGPDMSARMAELGIKSPERKIVDQGWLALRFRA